mmetsp:Transcript_40720/g.105256  ORF Transcript_40720/g.105256 Transcript_40720/m.105256 type:complete len:261 (+) Transcript_40720:2-784(+)
MCSPCGRMWTRRLGPHSHPRAPRRKVPLAEGSLAVGSLGDSSDDLGHCNHFGSGTVSLLTKSVSVDISFSKWSISSDVMRPLLSPRASTTSKCVIKALPSSEDGSTSAHATNSLFETLPSTGSLSISESSAPGNSSCSSSSVRPFGISKTASSSVSSFPGAFGGEVSFAVSALAGAFGGSHHLRVWAAGWSKDTVTDITSFKAFISLFVFDKKPSLLPAASAAWKLLVRAEALASSGSTSFQTKNSASETLPSLGNLSIS